MENLPKKETKNKFNEDEVKILKDAGYKDEEIAEMSMKEFKEEIDRFTSGKKEEIKDEERLEKKDNIPLSHIVKAEKYKWVESRDEFTEEEIDLLIDKAEARTKFHKKFQFDEASIRDLGPATYGRYYNWLKDELSKQKEEVEIEEVVVKEEEEKVKEEIKIEEEKVEIKEEEVIVEEEVLVKEDEEKEEDDKNEEEVIEEEEKDEILEKLKQTAVIVNIEEIAEAEARKAADARMTESKKSLKGFKKIFKKIWKHTFFDEYYRQKEINKVREEIKNTGNIYTGRIEDGNRIAHEEAMKGITDRFISEYENNEVLSKGEKREFLEEKDTETITAKNDIKNLVIDYAEGKLNEETFKDEKNRILNTLNKKDLLKDSNNYADNLFELAQNVKSAIEHGIKIKEIDLDTTIIIGKAKSSLKTEAHFNLVDKTIDKMKKSKIGRFISPAVLSTAVGLAYSVSVGVGTKVMRSKAAAWGTFGAAVAISATFAGMNESQRVSAERAQHSLDMAEGGEFESGSKRREQMEQFQYQMESSNDLSQELRGLMFEEDKDGNEIAKDIKKEDVDKIFKALSEIEARNSLNAKKKIDLIAYSDIGNVEKERTDLTILTAKAKVELRKKIEGGMKDGIPSDETFDSYLEKQTQVIEDSLLGGEKGITAKDKAFRKYKTKRIAKKVMQTAIVGLAVGATVQEGVAFFKDDIHGLVEGLVRPDPNNFHTQTPLSHIHDWIAGNSVHIETENQVGFDLNGHDFKMPEGTSIIENSDGTYDILRGEKIISDNIQLTFDSSNGLDAESIIRLGETGIVANTIFNVVEETQEIQNTAQDYINNHPESTHHIARDLWYGNDTSMYPDPDGSGKLLGADLNELKGHWGGLNGTGLDENGNIVLNHSQMTSDGSFHKEFSIDVQEKIKEGTLKLIFSLTQDTQHDVFEIPIGTDGNAVIDPDSEIGKLFFGSENGHAIFKGRFAEVVESLGSKDEVEHLRVISTLVGEGNDSINEIVPIPIEVPTTIIDIPNPPVGTEMPYFIPLVARRPLESLKNKDGNTLGENIPKTTENNKPNKTLKKGVGGIEKKEKDKQGDVVEIDIETDKIIDVKKFKVKNLSKIGTEFESSEKKYKVITKPTRKTFLGPKMVELLTKDKDDKNLILSYRKKDLEKEFKKGNIKITKVEAEK